jgi:hypothetical protein
MVRDSVVSLGRQKRVVGQDLHLNSGNVQYIQSVYKRDLSACLTVVPSTVY